MLADPGPFPTTFEMPAGVYDAARHRVLAIDVGYNTGATVVHALELTPELRWSTLPATGPSPVRPFAASLVLDTARDRLLVVGGELGDGAGSLGVWALPLSGAPVWERLVTSGSPNWRTMHATVYDAANDRVVVFAGMNQFTLEPKYPSTVWVLSLQTRQWVEWTPEGAGPGGRAGAVGMYDPVRQRMLVFGGIVETDTRSFPADTWELALGDTLAWRRIIEAGHDLGGRWGATAVYDPVRRRMLLHGGVDAVGFVSPDDVWSLTLDGDSAWRRLEAEDTPRGRTYSVDVYDPVADRLLSAGGAAYPQVSALSLAAPTRWESLWPAKPMSAPGPRTGNAVVYDSRRDRFAVIGGDHSSADSSVWWFQPDSTAPWTVAGSSVVPQDHDFGLTNAVVYDSLGDRFIMFDGFDAYAAEAANPRSWTPLGPQCPGVWSDVGRGAGVVLDAHRRRLLVTGGWMPYPHGAGYSLDGVWALSLDESPTWSFVGRLPHISAAHAAWIDTAHDRLVIAGGHNVRDTPRYAFDYGPVTWSTPLDSEFVWSEQRSSSGPVPLAPPKAFATFDPRTGDLFLATDSSLWVRGAYSSADWEPVPMNGPRVVAHSAIAFDAVRRQVLALQGSAPGAVDVQAWAIAIGAPALELLEAPRSSGSIALRWRSAGAFGRNATVERREDEGEWAPRGQLSFPVTGIASFTDTEVEPGHDYAYRVSVAGDTTVWSSAAAFVPDPFAPRFALYGARPHPVSGDFRLWFRLPDASPACVEIFDVRGRRCWRSNVGALGPGLHSLAITGRDTWRPGVYFARLMRGSESRSARLVVIR